MGSEPPRRAAGRGADDRGAVVVIVAAAMGALLVLAALVLDVGGARRDRDADQAAADAMALAAANDLGGSARSAAGACQTAWGYLVVNVPSVAGASAPACDAFATACDPVTARQVHGTVGEFHITFTHPVPGDHELLQGQAASALDGSPCDRFGVRVEQQRENLWMAGSVDLDVHAVGRFVRGTGDALAPLILLEPTACDVLMVNGTGVLQVSTAAGAPGYIDVDSDGSGCASTKSIILDVDGAGTITAGVISMWVLGGGDPAHAYDSTKKSLFDLTDPSVSPVPTASAAPVGRSGVDWRYNCTTANGCPDAGTAEIDALVADWGSGVPQPAGSFTSWQAAGYSCTPTGDVVVPAGDWYIDCGVTGVSTNGTITFQGGNIVTDGPVRATGAGGIRVNCSDADPSDGIAPLACPADPPEPTIFFQRSGDLVRNGDLELRETFVYLAAGTIDMAGNASLVWTAPDDPTHPFDDLLLWTESEVPIELTGTPGMLLEGIVFAPGATLGLGGTMGGEALGAQLFVDRLDLRGTADLVISPAADRMLAVGRGRPLLIR